MTLGRGCQRTRAIEQSASSSRRHVDGLDEPEMNGVEATMPSAQSFRTRASSCLPPTRGRSGGARADAGASGYMLKNSLRTQLMSAIRAVHAGRRPFQQNYDCDGAAHRSDALSPSEIRILRLIAGGLSTRKLPRSLPSPRGGEGQVKNILSKLGPRPDARGGHRAEERHH